MEVSRRDFLRASAGAAGLLLLQPPAKAMAKESQTQEGMAMLIDITKCVSCWYCYAACKQINNLPETVKPDTENPPPLAPDIWSTLYTTKINDRWRSRKQACMHCTDAACVKVCPTGALHYNELGFVQYDKLKCSGCGYCTQYCPFGVPKLESDPVSGAGSMDKCIFCISLVTEGKPTACAAACPVGAIKFGNCSELRTEGKQRVETLQQTNDQANFYGDSDVLGGLHVMYVLDESPEVYGLPKDPELPAPAVVHDIIQWVGIGAVAAIVAGFSLNYLVARMRMGLDERRKSYARRISDRKANR